MGEKEKVTDGRRMFAVSNLFFAARSCQKSTFCDGPTSLISVSFR